MGLQIICFSYNYVKSGTNQYYSWMIKSNIIDVIIV